MSSSTPPTLLTKSAIRNKAMNFSKKWESVTSEKSDSQSFWNSFFEIFGISLRNVGYFEVAATKLSTGRHGYIDLLVPGEMAVEQKSGGGDLNKAMSQLVDYLDSLQPGAMPKLLVACDFQRFYVQNLETKKRHEFELSELSANIELFWWLGGHREVDTFVDEEEANLKATAYMADIHDAVLASGYDPHALREWLTRILFCLFADDTEVWDRSAFTNYLFLNTKPDGLDLGSQLQYLFQILNTPDDKRASTIDEDLASFTYINGDLFSETLPIPSCDEKVRLALLEACKFNWSEISPAIFGSMFQNVMTAAERRHLGAHYTTEENILKTIRPLFLDDLEAELAAIKVSKSKLSSDRLSEFQTKLASLKFLDPACGCGNFLVIAYRELRRLEVETIRKRAIARGVAMNATMDVAHDLQITVDQFFGIELEEFPARIARTALYLMDHKENLAFSKEFGQYFARFPIPASPHIRVANALRFDWNDVLPVEECSFIMGNPPFVGMSLMNKTQQEDNRIVFSSSNAKKFRTGRFDYVACWYEKAMEYVGEQEPKVAFVSTNSLFQGEQARSMGPLIESKHFKIDFAHTTFAWTSEAKGKANVHCVIVGFSRRGPQGTKRLFQYATPRSAPTESRVANINIWLTNGPDVNIAKRTAPLVKGFPNATQGNKPTDGGHLIIGSDEIEDVLADPIASKFVRRFVQSRDMLHGEERWCLWLVQASPSDLRSSPILRHRLEQVADWRKNVSKTETVQQAAATPALFTQIRQPSTRYLAMPEVSSESRKFIPGRFLNEDSIAGNKLIVFPGAEEWFFGLMHSSMWNSWMQAVSGRLESRISFSPSIGYFTFPFPEVDGDSKSKLAASARRVLSVRANYPGASLADLYDPFAMPADLVKAHDELDRVVDSLFAPKKKFKTDIDRLEVLFECYAEVTKS